MNEQLSLFDTEIPTLKEKAEKSKNKQKKDDLDEMYEIGSSLDDIKKNENSDNIPDIKKSLTQIVNELKLTAEDLKGAVVDDNAWWWAKLYLRLRQAEILCEMLN